MSRTATSTNLISFMRNGEKRKMKDIIPDLAQWGYRNIDLNFCEMMNPSSDIGKDYFRLLERYSKDYELNYVQSHVPYPRDYMSLSYAERKYSDDLIKRAIEYSISLGVRAVVIHPVKGSIDENAAYLGKFLPLFDGSDSKLALENMENRDEISGSSQLLAVIEAAGTDHLGICLDTGHAHMRGLDVAEEVRAYGSHLIATHIADNHGSSDEHLLPFFGTICWEEVMKAFRSIDYKGWYTYECMFFTQHLPESLREDIVKLSLEIGKVLSALGE